MMSNACARDWSHPRNARAFTGFSGSAGGDPQGSLLLCVANTKIPCTAESAEKQKYFQVTVVAISKKGWIFSPWKKPSPKSKSVRDPNAKFLFEDNEWATNDTTMDRALKSLKMYSFLKDGQNRGERAEDVMSIVHVGQTFRVTIQNFMFEAKKTVDQTVFPTGVDWIPEYTMVEIMINPSNTIAASSGYGFSVGRVRPCDFSLYSFMNPIGLSLLPSNYQAALTFAVDNAQSNPVLNKSIEHNDVGFYGAVAKGSYLVKYNDELMRLVGPKEDPADPESRHINVMSNVYAIDIPHDVLFQFTNAVEGDSEDNLAYARVLVDFASAAGALSFYVTHNERLLRVDENRSPFRGTPLIDSNKLLDFIKVDQNTPETASFPLPFSVPNLENPFFRVRFQPEIQEEEGEEQKCKDFVLASDGVKSSRRYTLSLGDEHEECIMELAYIPKSGPQIQVGTDRPDYRALKRART